MARWKRKELEKAFDKYQAAALKGAQTYGAAPPQSPRLC